MGAFFCHGHQSFDPICLKSLCSLSPPPVMLHIKFDQDWPTASEIFKFEIFIIQGQVTPKLVVWSDPKSNSSELLCLSWLPATLVIIQSKMNELAWRQHFPIIQISPRKKLFFRILCEQKVSNGNFHRENSSRFCVSSRYFKTPRNIAEKLHKLSWRNSANFHGEIPQTFTEFLREISRRYSAICDMYIVPPLWPHILWLYWGRNNSELVLWPVKWRLKSGWAFARFTVWSESSLSAWTNLMSLRTHR